MATCGADFATVQAYLGGPAGFMQQMRQELLATRVAPTRVFTESFGPATGNLLPAPPAGSILAQAWLQASQWQLLWDGRHANLLQLQQAGLSPSYGCGQGSCLTCQTSLLRGAVTYEPELFFDPEPGTVLLCCAQPADDITLDL